MLVACERNKYTVSSTSRKDKLVGMSANDAQRETSRSASKRTRLLGLPKKKSRPALEVDTSVSRHRSQPPQQLLHKAPHETRTQEVPYQEPRFVSLDDVKGLNPKYGASKFKASRGLKPQPGNDVHLNRGPQRALAEGSIQQTKSLGSGRGVMEVAPPPYSRSKSAPSPVSHSQDRDSLHAPAMHRRIKGLRPTPLNLGTDISPSDRAIPIGIAIDSQAISAHSYSPQSGPPYPHSLPQRQESQKYGQQVNTPTIVITPAKEDFESEITASPEEMRGGSNRRPSSSVYSRHVNCLPSRSHDRMHPVPPLPLFAVDSKSSPCSGVTRESLKTDFNEMSAPPYEETPHSLNSSSVGTAFEESIPPSSGPFRDSRRLTFQSSVPTPRRSKGWWNVLMSPFSAASSSKHFFRSPPLPEEGEREVQPMMSDASQMGWSEPLTGFIFTDRPDDEDELRSAPPTDCTARNFDNGIHKPQRSDTAPGALDLGNADKVNIYRCPSKGAASSYFDSGRSFTSVIVPATRGNRDRGLPSPGWSPSQSVHRGDDDFDYDVPPTTGEAASYYDTNRSFPSMAEPPVGYDIDKSLEGWSPSQSVCRESIRPVLGGAKFSIGDLMKFPAGLVQGSSVRNTDPVDETLPPLDMHSADESSSTDGGNFAGFSATYPSSNLGYLSTPSEREIGAATPWPMSASQEMPQETTYSPLSPTPVLESARMGAFMGPQSARGELREVECNRGETPIGYGGGLGAGTMTSRDYDADNGSTQTMDEKTPYPLFTYHSRNDSQGLGISDDGSERGLYPPPRSLAEKTGFVTDTSEQQPLCRSEAHGESKRPRYKRFIWIFAVAGTFMLMALIILLVVFIPRHHNDIPVEAQWLDLTGFPPIPTGVSTVVGPRIVKDVSGCVSDESLWNCAAPSSMGGSTAGSPPDFRFLIRFRNGILANETALEPSGSGATRNVSNLAARSSEIVKRSAWSNYLYSSSPAPPSKVDQIFIGQTTDHVAEPYNGEKTPFYISLLNATELEPAQHARLRKRNSEFRYPYPTPSQSVSNPKDSSDSNGSNDSNDSNDSSDSNNSNDSVEWTSSSFDASIEAAKDIPNPALSVDGSPEPAELYPLSYAQPLRLFNRGQDDEHYGFYTYFDRSIHVSHMSINGSSSNSTSGISGPAVCTWSQTRLHVQIWTQKPDVNSLNTTAEAANIAAVNSTANDMVSPGSFPYSVTITLDRHGGDAGQKGLYCYRLDDKGVVLDNKATWIAEDRDFNGKLDNPATVPGKDYGELSRRADGEGNGIDGGTSGCSCQWQNWR